MTEKHEGDPSFLPVARIYDTDLERAADIMQKAVDDEIVKEIVAEHHRRVAREISGMVRRGLFDDGAALPRSPAFASGGLVASDPEHVYPFSGGTRVPKPTEPRPKLTITIAPFPDQRIDTSDDVRVEAVGENWLVAMNEDGYVTCCGYPESKVKVEDCVLVKKATADERHTLLLALAKIDGPRGIYARRVLTIGGVLP